MARASLLSKATMDVQLFTERVNAVAEFGRLVRELEGTVRTSKEAKSAAVSPNDPNYSFEDAMTGLTAQALAAELAEAKPLAAKVRAPEPTQDETTDCG